MRESQRVRRINCPSWQIGIRSRKCRAYFHRRRIAAQGCPSGRPRRRTASGAPSRWRWHSERQGCGGLNAQHITATSKPNRTSQSFTCIAGRERSTSATSEAQTTRRRCGGRAGLPRLARVRPRRYWHSSEGELGLVGALAGDPEAAAVLADLQATGGNLPPKQSGFRPAADAGHREAQAGPLLYCRCRRPT
jgi:hypothetical protein